MMKGYLLYKCLYGTCSHLPTSGLTAHSMADLARIQDLSCTNIQFEVTLLFGCLQEGAEAVAQAEEHKTETQGSQSTLPSSTLSQNALQSPAIARLGTSLQVLNQAHRGGEGLGPVPMRPTLLKMLGPLLKVQVC